MRGAAIVFVVYLHAYFSTWDVTPSPEVVAMRVIHLFVHTAVPVFFFVSAFLLALDSTPTFRQFASRKLRTILAPLAFWMAASFAYYAWQGGAATVKGSVRATGQMGSRWATTAARTTPNPVSTGRPSKSASW